MRILVIGGTGFIGHFLVPQLTSAGHDVVVLRRPEADSPVPEGVRVIRGDRRHLAENARALRELAADVVIDLILSSGRQASALMDTFRGYASRVVAITSIDVYRATAILLGLEGGEGELEPLPLREDSRLRSQVQTYPPAQIEKLKQMFGWFDDEYDKISVEQAVLGDADLSATVLRLPMIYGPGDQLHRFRPMLKRMDDGRPVIVFPESRAQWRSPRGYVANVAAAIALAATSDAAAGRIYNVAEAESFSELEWARLIADAAAWRGEFVVVPDDDAPPHLRRLGNLRQHWIVDSSRIRSELGYAEPISRDEAIRRTVAWEREHPPTIETTPFDYTAESEVAQRFSSRSDSYSPPQPPG
jgi:nucleoside-diphosphate-sugar epimerase